MNFVQSVAANKKFTQKQASKINFKITEPKNIQREYYRELNKLANALKSDINEKLMPVVQRTNVTDSTNDSVSEILTVVRELQNKYSNILAFSAPVANSVVRSVNRYNKNKFNKKSESQLGINPELVIGEGNINEMLALEASKQTALIKSIPDQFLKEVEVIITNGLSEGLRHEEIARQIKGIKNISSTFGKLENRVKLIARNEVENMNGTLNKYRQQNAGVNIYQWQTAGDERVRPSHRAMNGKYCKWDNATVYADTLEDAKANKWKKRSSIGGVEKHPAMDYNCRCVGLGVIEVD